MPDQPPPRSVSLPPNPAPSPEQMDRHIAEGRAIVRQQLAVVRQLRRDGLPADAALALLAALRETVGALRRQRRNAGDTLTPPPPGRPDAPPAHPPEVRQA